MKTHWKATPAQLRQPFDSRKILRLYEAPVALVGAQVMLLYQPHDPARVECQHEGRTRGMLRPVDVHVNCRVRRRKEAVRLEFEPRPVSGGRLSFANQEESPS